jgi:hypothetical protein
MGQIGGPLFDLRVCIVHRLAELGFSSSSRRRASSDRCRMGTIPPPPMAAMAVPATMASRRRTVR